MNDKERRDGREREAKKREERREEGMEGGRDGERKGEGTLTVVIW